MSAIKAGATGFLRKDCTKDDLLYATRCTLAGKRYISPELTEQILSAGNSSNPHLPHEILTEREMDVCSRLAGGARVINIATSLNLSTKTISTHKTRAFRKMQVRTTSELVIKFAQHGYIKIDGPLPGEVLSA
jgi:DNA-binding NarL/FixJ family response regulator